MSADNQARGGVSEVEAEAAARAILIIDGNEMMRDDAVWSRKLKLHRDTADDLGSFYLAGSSYMVDALRRATAALEAAAQVRAGQEHGGEAGEVERLRALLAQPERQPMGFHERHAVLHARAVAAEARAAKAVEVLTAIRDADWVENCLDPQWAARQAATLLSDHPAPEPGVEAGEVRNAALEEAAKVAEAMPRAVIVRGRYHDTAEGLSFLEKRPTNFADAAAAIRALQTPANGGQDGK